MIKNPYILLLFYLTLASCALQKPPSGGPKDEEAPVVVFSEPENETVNFASEKIILTFDEYVQLENPYNEIVISPPIKPDPSFLVKGKRLFIDLKKSNLEASTTYSIFFGNSIVDYTANNSASNLSYVFSTGKFIDSLQLSGNVYDAETNKPVEGVLVMLYKDLNDSVITSGTPNYFSKTGVDGSFEIKNIKENTYRVFALNDKNRNYIYDLEDESIGFPTRDIDLSPYDSSNILSIKIFNPGPRKQYVKSIVAKNPGLILFSLSKPLTVFKLDTELYSNSDIISLNSKKDSVKYWYTDVYKDSAKLYLSIDDGDILDTITLFLDTMSLDLKKNAVQIESKGGKKGKKESVGSLLSVYKPLIIKFSRPIDTFDLSKIRVFEDTLRTRINPEIAIDDDSYESLELRYPWKGNTKYEIVFLDSSVTDYLGTPLLKKEFLFNTDDPDDYGELILSFDQLQDSYLVEVYSQNDKLIKSFPVQNEEDNKIYAGLFKGGSYRIRVVEDANQNGKWDTGNLKNKLQAEEIIYYSEKLNLRGSWENEFEIKLRK